MKKSIIAVALSTALLTACGNQQSQTVNTVKQQTMSANDAVQGKAELGNFGVDLTARNLNVKPGDDFFMYAGGTWYDNYELPSDKTRFGAFSALAERSEERVKEIIDELSTASDLSGEAKLIADFYNSYMDTAALNKKGIEPIQSTLNSIKAIANTDQLAQVFGNAWLTGTSAPIGGGMWYDRLDPNKYQLSVGVGGLGLPDRDYYLSENERFVKIREAYQAHIAEMLAFTGSQDAAAEAEIILGLETRIAELQWPREKRRNRDLTLNQIDREQLNQEYEGFNWDAFFEPSGFVIPNLNISQPQPVKDVIALIASTDLDTWKSYLTYHTISNNAGLLSDDIYQANFKFYGTTLSGQQEPRARWKRAVSQMSGTTSLGFAIGKVYVDKYFPESSKTQMAALVENLRSAMVNA